MYVQESLKKDILLFFYGEGEAREGGSHIRLEMHTRETASSSIGELSGEGRFHGHKEANY